VYTVAGRAARQLHAHRDFALLHHALAVFFLVVGIAAAVLGHPHVVQVQLGHVEIVHAGIADRGQDAAQVRVGGEEGGLHQRRVADRVGDLAALFHAAALFHHDTHELGGAFAVAHDGLRQEQRQFGHGVASAAYSGWSTE
jgi:hypothetical protein